MCGIFGIYTNENSKAINKHRFTDSLKIISHRGPDNINSYFHNSNALGHARLSIIDLNNNSNQPFHSLDNRYSLIFNGEIFNYIEIKKDLDAEGIVFKTESDTEVLLKAFICWGKSCVKKFNGMWAFIIYDSLKNEFFCSRDRFGIKPLYYCQYNNQHSFHKLNEDNAAVYFYTCHSKTKSYDGFIDHMIIELSKVRNKKWLFTLK